MLLMSKTRFLRLVDDMQWLDVYNIPDGCHDVSNTENAVP